MQDRLNAQLRAVLGPIYAVATAAADETLPAPARGVLFQLAEGLGCVARGPLETLLRPCDGTARKRMARLGVRLGTLTVHVDGLHGAAPRRLRAILRGIVARCPPNQIALGARAVARGAPGFARLAALDDDFYRACGLVALGPLVLSCARAEMLAAETRKLARQGTFAATDTLRKCAGGSLEDLVGMLLALGFSAEKGPDGMGFQPQRQARPGAAPGAAHKRAHRRPAKTTEATASEGPAHKKPYRRVRAKKSPADIARAAREAKRMADSPFAALRGLKFSPRKTDNT